MVMLQADLNRNINKGLEKKGRISYGVYKKVEQYNHSTKSLAETHFLTTV